MGADYSIKAHPQANVLYGQVGNGDADHACRERPQDMTTPRTSNKIDEQHPGSDLAGETAVAFAAASIAFSKSDPDYSSQLLDHAKQLFDFANSHQGMYQNSIPQAHSYSSSGFQDELLWAAAWLYRATNDKTYSDYLSSSGNTGGTRTMFSWDDKYSGAQVPVAKLILKGKAPNDGNWGNYKNQGEQFICPSYSDSLSAAKDSLNCPADSISPDDIISFARSQVDYILGKNPKGMSYMVGYGSSFPRQVHHRGASIVQSTRMGPPVDCPGRPPHLRFYTSGKKISATSIYFESLPYKVSSTLAT
ncbi:Endoglucanase 13 [Vitis vinifera]|uniref:Endoglucanase n=1 Tax=Vitis vinifera TaxID=29760 RepID=A0A438IMY1_VITVI|nr:Endoglucanase 13 [Vitis vinifera]